MCPWNRKAPEPDVFPPEFGAPPLERMAGLTEADFKRLFRDTPVNHAKYSGFLRNVAVAMGNSGLEKFRAPLEKLAASGDSLVVEHAEWALLQLSTAD